MTLSEMLNAIKENPEDLTNLPKIIEGVIDLEKREAEGLEKIGKLQELNRKYLSMIPVVDEVEEKEEKEEEPPSIEEAVEEILKGGN